MTGADGPPRSRTAMLDAATVLGLNIAGGIRKGTRSDEFRPIIRPWPLLRYDPSGPNPSTDGNVHGRIEGLTTFCPF